MPFLIPLPKLKKDFLIDFVFSLCLISFLRSLASLAMCDAVLLIYFATFYEVVGGVMSDVIVSLISSRVPSNSKPSSSSASAMSIQSSFSEAEDLPDFPD